MTCPSCGSNLDVHQYILGEVDICQNCKGIWFDNGEITPYLTRLINTENIPDRPVYKSNEVLNKYKIKDKPVNCPRCQQEMELINYAYDSNIILDKCPECSGLWVNGGESYKLATHLKGNPVLKEFGETLVKDMRANKEYAENVNKTTIGILAFKSLIPIGDEASINTIPFGVIAIIVLNIIFYATGLFVVKDQTFIINYYGLIVQNGIQNNILSVFTYMFVHGDVLHIAINLLFLWIFGDNIEAFLGTLKFVMFYLLIGLVTAISAFFFYQGLSVPIVGASGAISGIMGAYLILHPKAKIKTLIGLHTITLPAFAFLPIWFIFQFLGNLVPDVNQDQVAWWLHISGFLSGVILIYLYKTFTQTKLPNPYTNTGIS